jgi:hypothetical protein
MGPAPLPPPKTGTAPIPSNPPSQPLLIRLPLLLQVGRSVFLLHLAHLGTQFALEVLAGLRGKAHLVCYAAIIHESRVLRDLLLDFEQDLRRAGNGARFGGQCRLERVPLDFSLALADLLGALQCINIRLVDRANLWPANVERLAGRDRFTGDQRADLIIGHAPLPQVVHFDLAFEQILAQSLLLHRIGARLELFLRALPVRIQDGAGRKHAGGEQCKRIQAGQSERGDGFGQFHDLRRQPIGSENPGNPQGRLAELYQQIGVVLQPPDQIAKRLHGGLERILELGPHGFPQFNHLAA